MQAGFAMLEVGTVRSKNSHNILLKNIVDVCAGTIFWWILGYSFAYGDTSNDFIGFKNPFKKVNELDWFFQWAFATTATTIVSGSIAERTRFLAYLIYSSIMTAFIYPVIVHWTWGGGWLYKKGYVDFAGSGIVHMVGGCAGLAGTIILGPRTGRFQITEEKGNFKPYNIPLVVLGTIILWFGWYGFNAGSTLGFTGNNVETASLIVMNTSIAAAAGGLTVLFATRIFTRHIYDVMSMCNGILAGLVSVTASCNNIDNYAAFIIGIIGAFVYMIASNTLMRFKIDDPLDAFAIHGAAGAWGVLAVSIFDRDGVLFKWQLAGILSIILWSSSLAGIVFFGLKKANMLRIDLEEEEIGLDESHHGGKAVNLL
jgi:Amt family ammonium transporter